MSSMIEDLIKSKGIVLFSHSDSNEFNRAKSILNCYRIKNLNIVKLLKDTDYEDKINILNDITGSHLVQFDY